MAKNKLIMINSQTNCSSEYVIKKTGDVVLCSTRPPPEGGIGKSLLLTFPVASENPGRSITVKDAGGYANINKITIQRAASDFLDGGSTHIIIDKPAEYKTFVSDGDKTWHQIG